MKISRSLKTILSASLVSVLTACGLSVGGSSPSYQIVIDAGSTGNRAFVYQVDKSTAVPTITNVFTTKNDIALANFVANPTDAGPTAIQPLLDNAEAFISANYEVSSDQITTSVLGTAGMRLIPSSDQTNIYQSVTNTINNENLSLGTVGTITGQNEGLYGWLNVNYLLNNFTDGSPTQGIIEVGGTSAQVAFASTSGTPKTIEVGVNGTNYFVFSASFLGLGQDQARAQMNSTPNQNQCYPFGYNNGSITGNFNLTACVNNYSIVTSSSTYADLNTISSAPGFNNQQFIGLSGVFFSLDFFGLAAQPSQQLLEQNIASTCSKTYSELQTLYPNAFQLFNQCANASYMDELIYNDLSINSNQLSALSNVNGTELNFTLGFVLFNSL